MITVEIVADSINQFGNRITSMVLTYPRIIHAELLTHRMFSRNAASSRAIRFSSMADSVIRNPFIPMAWQKDHPGMQGAEYFTDPDMLARVNEIWLTAAEQSVSHAQLLNNIGVTKQICNRLIEPFQMYQTLVTATEFENFVNLRASEYAEIHFADLAEKILAALNESEPKSLRAGEWHIPFGDKLKFDGMDIINYDVNDEMLRVKLATVRCARISYLNHGKETTIEEDLKLYDRLTTSGHYSAHEHCARVMSDAEYSYHYSGTLLDFTDTMEGYSPDSDGHGWCGNFRGFIQLRKTLPNENRTDSRLIKKHYDNSRGK